MLNSPEQEKHKARKRAYYTDYRGGHQERIVFPLGGMGAGMFGLEGTGALSHFSLRNKPDLLNEPMVFSALSIKGDRDSWVGKVLEGPVPTWKITGRRGNRDGWGNGLVGRQYGLPRFAESSFRASFPFGIVELNDPALQLQVEMEGWNPFTPLHGGDSSLPVAGLSYTFTNRAAVPRKLIYSFHAEHLMAVDEMNSYIAPLAGGFALMQPPPQGRPWDEGALAISADSSDVYVHHAWFRGNWWDSLTTIWKAVETGKMLNSDPVLEGKPSRGASLFIPLRLEAGESRTVRLRFAWYVPQTDLSIGHPDDQGIEAFVAQGVYSDFERFYKPWYSGQYANVQEVMDDFISRYHSLRERSLRFATAMNATNMPSEILEAVNANLSILKSPTLLRQTDGRLWGWEGTSDAEGSCFGSCTHVWNYAQAISHLFPALERGLRVSEFGEGQDERGHQNFRLPLPIRSNPDHTLIAAADGQLGGIMKAYREWRISGDTDWLRALWPAIQRSLRYCMETWDPEQCGVLVEPHHTTYDIDFWGPNGMCGSLYLGALKAASRMASAVGEDPEVSKLYEALYAKGRDFLEQELFNGEYFEQQVRTEGLRTPPPFAAQAAIWNIDYSWEAAELHRRNTDYSPEALALYQEEGPKYQYGKGCLSDGLIGAWLAEMCGLGTIIDPSQVRSHLMSVYKYNLKRELSAHANPQRPGFALGTDGGLLLCTWPRGGKPTLPFVYCDEVWTGIEYQVASHLMLLGCLEEGLEIVRVCRDRYDGQVRNPFDEYECGHWYVRALSSYGLIQAWSGIRYDAVEQTLYVSPWHIGDFSSFLCTATGYGVAGVRNNQVFYEPIEGTLAIRQVVYQSGEEGEKR